MAGSTYAYGYVYAINDSSSYFSVTAYISWDDSYWTTVEWVSAEYDKYFSWRIKGRASQGDTNTYAEKNGTHSFQGVNGKQYVFQVSGDGAETSGSFNNNHSGAIFTIGSDSGGGDSGGGDYADSYYVYYYNKDGTISAWTNEIEGQYFTVRSGSSVTKPDSSSSDEPYIITGNANGGSFSDGSTTTSITAIKTITTNYNFSSWNTNSSGTGSTYYAGSSYIMPSHNLSLYPIFSSSSSISYSNNSLSRLPNPSRSDSTTITLTATFNANGGSVSTTSQSVDATITKIFGGWMNSSGTVITSLDSAGTVKAKWDDSYSNNMLILPLPSRSGYNFNGWSTSTSGTNLQPAGETVFITNDVTYYAIWTEKEKPKGGIFIHDGTIWQLITNYIYDGNSWKTTE